ncbi:MAG TPA: L-histidine N(alpha)-methyltransferase [Methylomirabilota bacterium]|jgi:L-histidine N-alpha-methyltransferase
MPFHLDAHRAPDARHRELAADVRRGLGGRMKALPPKHFYDDAGSALFEEITRLPEYYLTRAEQGLLGDCASDVVERARPGEIVELGAGGVAKVSTLLGAQNHGAADMRYVPIDVDGEAITRAARALLEAFPSLTVHGVVGDFERDLGHLPAATTRRLVTFFGSTIGNLDAPARHRLLTAVRKLLEKGDRFLVGVDLVKDRAVLEAAYNDAAGVTAEFNRNVLRVVNRALHADFEPSRFRHRAFYNDGKARIEMHLVADTPQRVHVRDLDMKVEVEEGETIWTESSYKFTPDGVRRMLGDANLELEQWYTDPENRVGLALAAAA